MEQWWNEGAFIPMQSSRVRSNEATTTRACAAASPSLLNYITLHYATLHYISTTTRVCSFASPSLHYITLHYITLHYITLPRHAPAPPRALRQPSARAHPRARARCCSAAGRADSARETRSAQQMRMADGGSWRVVKEEEDSPQAGRTSRTAREECGRRSPP